VAGQVIVDDQDVPAFFHEEFGHGGCRVGDNVLNPRWLVSRRHDDDTVGKGVIPAQVREELGHGGTALADCTVNAQDVLAALVQDRIQGDGCLARLTVTQDQLALTAADRQQ